VIKRTFDLSVALVSLLALAPILFAVSVWIKLDSRGPVLFRQQRVGRGGKLFWLLKFRSMVHQRASQGPLITARADHRVTRSGHFLRKYKIDELPQLINVIQGEMSFVGPRPEVPEFVEYYPREVRAKVLSVRPGITDAASIMFRNENDLIDAADDPERRYVEKILPIKLQMYSDYVDDHSFAGDLRLMIQTIASVFKQGSDSVQEDPSTGPRP
jgi:lipopolysaccharide/colanic/teichoic acid biosynthesis glycosyltransferase